MACPRASSWSCKRTRPSATAIVVSPYAKKGIDKTVYDTTSVLATLEKRWSLEPLSDRDAHAKDMSAAFDFQQKPRQPPSPSPDPK